MCPSAVTWLYLVTSSTVNVCPCRSWRKKSHRRLPWTRKRSQGLPRTGELVPAIVPAGSSGQGSEERTAATVAAALTRPAANRGRRLCACNQSQASAPPVRAVQLTQQHDRLLLQTFSLQRVQHRSQVVVQPAHGGVIGVAHCARRVSSDRRRRREGRLRGTHWSWCRSRLWAP